MIKFKQWMATATVAEKNKIAEEANTSLAMLYHISSGHKQASAAWAQRVVKAINDMSGADTVDVGDLVPACATCPHFLKCRSSCVDGE